MESYNQVSGGIIRAAGAQLNPVAPTPLGQASDLALQAERIGNIIESFIDRCRGGGNLKSGSQAAPTPTGHLSQLSILSSNLARAEELARDLGNIG